MTGKALFCIGTNTAYQAISPVIDEVANQYEVEYLFFDSFFNRSENDPRTVTLEKTGIPHEYSNVSEYVNHPVFESTPKSWSTIRKIWQRTLLDNISSKIAFDVDRCLAELDPDIIVTAGDQFPFVRHLIHYCHGTNRTTIAIQHGMYGYDLSKSGGQSGFFEPKYGSDGALFERLKRRFGYRFGTGAYLNPYTDTVLTLGEFFRERIDDLRDEYPCFGHTELLTTGSPEYDGNVKQYQPRAKSVLYLSVHKLEGGAWDADQHNQIIKRLASINDRYDLTIRPHPKEPSEKINQYYSEFEVSTENSLSEDVENHDVILTVDSTAILEGVIQGKVTAILQPPWKHKRFDPLVDEHMIQVTNATPDFEHEAAARSVKTQREYLSRYCCMPSLEASIEVNSSVEMIADIIRKKIGSNE
jgi:hypothetical protein